MSKTASRLVTRFAPSPTGHLHIGGVRTALYNWLYARNKAGRFLLRIEDTDRERSKPEYERGIVDGLRWLGLDWDDEPMRQSERSVRYGEALAQLLGSGRAYRCVCPPERLDQLRAEQMASKVKPGYDGRCRDAGIGAGSSQPFVVRLRTPNEGRATIEDSLRGAVSVDNRELDDLVLARSDGTPTYQLSVVVDDIDSGVSHIIRGDDHLNNALRQTHLYSALDERTPEYTHLPLILDESGKRYSKRMPGADINVYRRGGVLPEALLNYLLRLGWARGDAEVFTIAEMIGLFSLDGLNRSAASFNPGKLEWLNRQHLQALPPERIRAAAAEFLDFRGAQSGDGVLADNSLRGAGQAQNPSGEAPAGPGAALDALRSLDRSILETGLSDAVIGAARGKASDLGDLLALAMPLIDDSAEPDPAEAGQYTGSECRVCVAKALDAIAQTGDWSAKPLAKQLKALCQSTGIKMPQIAMPMRFALLGTVNRLGIGDILAALGKEESLRRLRAYLDETGSSPEE